MKNVVAISGAEAFLRTRALRTVLADQTDKHGTVYEVDASVPGGITTAFSYAALSGEPILAVVHNPDKDLPSIEQHLQTGDTFVTLLLYYEGEPKENSKFGKFLVSLGPDNHRFSVSAKIWEQEDAAESFCIAEARTHKLKMSSVLARSLVEHVGVDMGMLSFEILKAAMLAKADGSKEITKPVLRACLATVSEGGIQQVVDALAARNAQKLSKALNRVFSTHKDPLILLCRTIENKAYSWLPFVKAREDGLTPKEAAEALGINPWFYTNKLFPQTTRWGTPDILRLMQAMATSERSLLRGSVNPEAGLIARLLSFCTG